MIKGIPKNAHGIADYTYIPAVLVAPKIGGFEDDKLACGICKANAVIALGSALFTDANWGVFKKIPYKTHAALDLGIGVANVVTSYVLPNSGPKARKTLLLMGLTGIIVGALSIIGAKNDVLR